MLTATATGRDASATDGPEKINGKLPPLEELVLKD
jgi:hypothetical protein